MKIDWFSTPLEVELADGEEVVARWNAARQAWVAESPAPLSDGERVTVTRLVDGEGKASRSRSR